MLFGGLLALCRWRLPGTVRSGRRRPQARPAVRQTATRAETVTQVSFILAAAIIRSTPSASEATAAGTARFRVSGREPQGEADRGVGQRAERSGSRGLGEHRRQRADGHPAPGQSVAEQRRPRARRLERVPSASPSRLAASCREAPSNSQSKRARGSGWEAGQALRRARRAARTGRPRRGGGVSSSVPPSFSWSLAERLRASFAVRTATP